MFTRKKLFLFLILCFCAKFSKSFQPVVLQVWGYGKTGSNFGYAVQINGDKLYVGAPMEDNVGAVHECDLYKCSKLNLTVEEHMNYTSLFINQQLGSSLETYNNTLVACASKWKNDKYKDFYFLNGYCLLQNLTSKSEKSRTLMPLMTLTKQGAKDDNGRYYYNYIFGQAGFSVDVSKDGFLTMGAPGLAQWVGSIAQYDLKSGNKTASVPNPLMFYKDIIHNRFWEEMYESEYFGFAVASGRFRNWGISTIVGAPRANNLTGQVFILKNNLSTSNIVIEKRFSGREIGEYFGSVLAVGDITGDGFDDILVGAPMYAGRVDEGGCIYVLTNKDHHYFSQQIIESPQRQRKGRFGYAISVIGDIDQDGYNDVAVGAPNEDVTGVVYIYLGSKNGLVEQPYYRIKGIAINRGFGFSISRGVHYPSTGITQVAVGAYKSSHAMMVNFRPIIRTSSTLKSNEQTLNFEKIQAKNFKFSLTACIKLTARYLSNRKYFFNTRISADPYYNRIILTNNTSTLACKNNESCCNFYLLTMEEGLYSRHSFMEQLEFRFEYNLYGLPTEKADPSFPELALNNPTSELLSIPFETDCGEKNFCQPELKLDARWLLDSETYIIGSKSHIDVEIIASNKGDSAYSCTLYVTHNIPLLILPERCVEINEDKLECNMGNPLKSQSNRIFILQFDPTFLDEAQSGISVSLNLTSFGIEKNVNDNNQTLNLKIGREYNIIISSVSKPDQFLFNYTEEHTTEIVQTYELHNQGPSPINLFIFILSIPKTVENQISTVEISGTEVTDGEILNTYCDYQLITWQNKYFTMLDSVCKLDNSYLSEWKSYDSAFYKCQKNEYGCTQYFCACNGKNVKDISVRLSMKVELYSLQNQLGQEEILVFNTNVMPIVSNKTYENCHEAATIFIGETKPTDVFPWIIVGVIIGILILNLLIIGLWKVGFFKRVVLPTAEEAEGIVEDVEIDELPRMEDTDL